MEHVSKDLAAGVAEVPAHYVNVTGNFPKNQPRKGHTYRFHGTWKQNHTYGLQVEVRWSPSTGRIPQMICLSQFYLPSIFTSFFFLPRGSSNCSCMLCDYHGLQSRWWTLWFFVNSTGDHDASSSTYVTIHHHAPSRTYGKHLLVTSIASVCVSCVFATTACW